MNETREVVVADAIEKIIDAVSKINHSEWTLISQSIEISFHVKATKRTLNSGDVEKLKKHLKDNLLS